MKRLLTVIALCLTFGPSQVMATEKTSSAQDLILVTTNQILERLKAEKETLEAQPGKLYEMVDEMLLPHFDFERMSRWVLGKYWSRTDEKQRGRFSNEFKQLLVRTYAKALLEYTDQKIVFLPYENGPQDKEVIVRSEVDQPGGFAIPIHYSLHLKGQGWKVYDVQIDGVSLVANYRTTFAREIRRGGVDKLIVKLARRNQQAAGE